MKTILFLILSAVCAFAESPDSWYAAYSARERRGIEARVKYVEAQLPDDTQYRKLSELVISGQFPMERYLLKYYLAHNPDRLIWDQHGPFLQVYPCNCGKENSIDSDEFRRLFPAFSLSSSSWDELDLSVQRRYTAIVKSIPESAQEREEAHKELLDLKERFEKLKSANKSVDVTPTAVTPAAYAPGAPSAGVHHH